jgi:hypothetical protein
LRLRPAGHESWPDSISCLKRPRGGRATGAGLGKKRKS